jgi:hypothetical protein
VQAPQQWVVVAQFPDAASAQVTIGLLQSERVPVRLRCNSPMPGLDIHCDIEVPGDYSHRARWILNHCKFSDAELNFLATGEPLQDDE